VGVGARGTLRGDAGGGGAAAGGTLRDGAVTGLANQTFLGGTHGSRLKAGGINGASDGWVGLLAPCKMSIRVLRARAWLSVRGTRGEFGDGFCRAWSMSAISAWI